MVVIVVVPSGCAQKFFQVVAIAKLHSACQQRWSTEQLPLVPAKQAIRQISPISFCSSIRVGKCPLLGILNITFKYLLEIVSPIVG